MIIQDPAAARIGVEILPFECENVPEFFQKKGEAELHDTPDRRSQGILQIKDLIKKDRHTKNLEFDDDFLVQFLRIRKYNVSKAFSQLKAIANFKKKHPEVFTDIFYEEVRLPMTQNVLTFSPWRCHEGCAILIGHLENWDPSKIPLNDMYRGIFIYLLQALREPMTQINGFKVIINVKSNSMWHLRYMTPANLYMLYHGAQECVPARYKEIHFVNESLPFKAAWCILKYFLSEKLKKRIHFHSSIEALQAFFAKSILPVELGGELENYHMYDWLKKVVEPEKLEKLAGRPRQT